LSGAQTPLLERFNVSQLIEKVNKGNTNNKVTMTVSN